MKKTAISFFLSILLCLVVSPVASAVGINFRAQGHYYSAKDAFENKQYVTALDFVHKCEKTLKGTNEELQYLHVLSAYHAGKALEAQTEMHRFFDLAEGKLKRVSFGKGVDRLTDDEVRSLTMLMNKIEDGPAEQERAKEKAFAELRSRISALESEKARLVEELKEQRHEYGYYDTIKSDYERERDSCNVNRGTMYEMDSCSDAPRLWRQYQLAIQRENRLQAVERELTAARYQAERQSSKDAKTE